MIERGQHIQRERDKQIESKRGIKKGRNRGRETNKAREIDRERIRGRIHKARAREKERVGWVAPHQEPLYVLP